MKLVVEEIVASAEVVVVVIEVDVEDHEETDRDDANVQNQAGTMEWKTFRATQKANFQN